MGVCLVGCSSFTILDDLDAHECQEKLSSSVPWCFFSKLCSCTAFAVLALIFKEFLQLNRFEKKPLYWGPWGDS